MQILTTIAENWFTLLQSAGIVGSLLFGAASLRDNTNARRAESFLRITAEHRRIWKDYYSNPALKRVRSPDADLVTSPITNEERKFVQGVILHVNAVFHANRLGSVIEPEGLKRDIRNFFSLPIPAETYREQKELLDSAFVDYIEDARAGSSSDDV